MISTAKIKKEKYSIKNISELKNGTCITFSNNRDKQELNYIKYKFNNNLMTLPAALLINFQPKMLYKNNHLQ